MRTRIRVFLVLLLICFVTIRTSAQGFSVTTKLRGNLNWPATDIFDETRNTFQGQADLYPDYDVTVPGRLGSLNGLEGELSLFYDVPRVGEFGAAVGYGCFRYKRFTSAWEYTPDPQWTSTDKLRLGLQTLPVTFQYQWPCRFVDKLHWNAGIGLDFMKSDFYYNFTQTSPGDTAYQIGTLTDNGIGWHGGFGAQYQIVPRLSLTFDVKYRSAALDNYRGTLRNENGEYNKALLARGMVESGYIFGARYESDPNFDEAKPAKLDFSGLQIGLGIQYNIFKTKLNF